jgi:hypothetical protein
MSLFDFFFPDVAQASHLRRLADASSLAATQSRLSRVRSDQQRLSAEARMRDLESEVARLTLVLEALIEKMLEDGSAVREDLAARIAEIDLRDGVADGKITPPAPSGTRRRGVRFNSPE